MKETAEYWGTGNTTRVLKVGRHVVSLWLVAVIVISLFGSVLGYMVYTTISVPLEVNEPIEIVGYPSQFSLYSGETINFNVTVNNHASLNYSVILNSQLSNSTYQTSYVAFSDLTYAVVPGIQDLAAWLRVASDAPATSVTVTIEAVRTLVGSWWDPNWQYRKSHMILNATGAGANYAVSITVVNGTGSDSNDIVYVNSSKSDFGDIRFTDNKAVPLDYYAERVYYGANATFWVRIAENLSYASQTIYIYYGSSGAISLSNPSKTFLFYDGFDSFPSGWTNYGMTKDTSGYEYGNASARSVCNASLDAVQGALITRSDVALMAWFRLESISPGHYTQIITLVDTRTTHIAQASVEYDGTYCYWGIRYVQTYPSSNPWVYSFSTNTLSPNTWYFVQLLNDGSFIRLVVDGIQKHVVPFASLSPDADMLGYAGTYHSDYTFSENMGGFIARNYVYPEPTHGAWGSQETGTS